MTHEFSRHPPTDTRGGYVVRRPRQTDAIGSSLRNAFDRDARLPCDIAAMLASLDHIS